ncbi:MAG: hypothetical protein ACRDHF_14845, partial [Tepidiformaceae bacterium]
TGQTVADASGNNNALRRGNSTSGESADPSWVAGAPFDGGSVALLGGGPDSSFSSARFGMQAVLPAGMASRRAARRT